MAIKRVEHAHQGGQIAAQVAQQIVDHAVRKIERTRGGMPFERQHLFVIGERLYLIDQPPSQPGDQFRAKLQSCRRRVAGNQHDPGTIAQIVVEIEKRALVAGVHRLDVVHRHGTQLRRWRRYRIAS